MLEVCDIVEYNGLGLDCSGKVPTYRVTHHLKVQTWSEFRRLEKPTKDLGAKWIRKWCDERLTKERKARKNKGQPYRCRHRFLHCRPEEATHVSLSGVGGAIAPISECKKIGVVKWDAPMIEEHKREALSDFWLGNDKNFHCEWYWTNLPAKRA